MSRSRLYLFTVQGSGTFPVDMLRKDQCWPKDEIEDSPKILGEDHRRVTLIGLHRPSKGRWESFGWDVVRDVVV